MDRRAWCETSTARSIVPMSGASRTVAIGVTSYFNPGILERVWMAALTYLPTLVPDPMGWMLNSAIVTIVLFGRATLATRKE